MWNLAHHSRKEGCEFPLQDVKSYRHQQVAALTVSSTNFPWNLSICCLLTYASFPFDFLSGIRHQAYSFAPSAECSSCRLFFVCRSSQAREILASLIKCDATTGWWDRDNLCITGCFFTALGIFCLEVLQGPDALFFPIPYLVWWIKGYLFGASISLHVQSGCHIHQWVDNQVFWKSLCSCSDLPY